MRDNSVVNEDAFLSDKLHFVYPTDFVFHTALA